MSSYTLTYLVPSTQTAPAAATGTSATLPAMSDYTAGGVNYRFVGWVAAVTAATTTAPTLYTAGSTYEFSEDTELYACYTYDVTTGGSSDRFVLTDTLTSGKDYVFLTSNAAGSAYALDAGKLTAPTSSVAGTGITIVGGTPNYVDTPNTDLIFRVTVDGKMGSYTKYKMTASVNNEERNLTINGSGIGSSSNYKAGFDSAKGLFGTNKNNSTRYFVYGDASGNLKAPSSPPTGSRMYAYERSEGAGGTTTTYYTTGDAAPAASVVYTVSVTADKTTIAVGEEAYLEATLYADGVAVGGAVPAWTNSKNTVATMETAGNICTVKGVAAGTTQVRATYTLPDGTTKYGYKSITVTGGGSTEQPTTYSTTYNSGTRGALCTAISANGGSGYYTDGLYDYATLSQQTGSTLLSSLRALNTARKTGSTSYDDCKNYANKTDCQKENQKVTLLYTGYEAEMSQNSASAPGWNREHVWPKSLGGFDTFGPGSDILHIRPDDVTTNGDRGNKKFGNVTGGTASTATITGANGALGGHYNNNYYEPLDSIKGDVARICLYVYMGYGDSYSQCGDLTNVFESTDVLLDWMQRDPVDTWEMGRNEVAQAIQGNRNPFVDYPEYAWLIFGQSVPTGYTTPSNPTGAVRTAAATEAAPAKRGVTPTDIVNGVTGSAIIDGMGSSFSMADFEKYGPKTEVYLAKNQAVVFYLENGKAGQDVQIGAKAVNGTAAGLTVITLKSSSAGGATQTLQKPLATATEMYYEIGADLTWDQGTSCAILVANTGDGVLALTNLRSSAAVRMQINKDITDVARSIMTRVADGSMVYGADGYVTVVDSSPKPDPVEPTPNPVKPTPDPVEPTPDPVDPKPDPVEPTPDPVKPTPDPVEPKPMPKFTDLDEGAWYEAGVRYAVEAGLMRGTSETTFEPDGTLTRAMLVTVLYRLAGEPDVKTAHRFTDVPDGCWYSDAVAWAAETGLTNGVSETRFAPDEAVTREQMVTFLWRYAGQPDSKQSLEGFPDAQKVSGYARTALAWAVEHGVIGGNRVGSVNYLDPTEGATRAQIATIFMRSKNLLANE